MEDSNNCKYIISVEYVGSGDDIILNMLILSGKHYLEKYFEENNLEDNICLAISNFSYFIDGIEVQ